MSWIVSRTMRRLTYVSAALAGILGAGSAMALPAPLQVQTVSANTPSGGVIQGLVTFNPNTKSLAYCLAAPFGAERQCTVKDLSGVLTSGDTGPAGGRLYQLRIDEGGSGNVPFPSGQSGQVTPILHPAVYITRIATVDQSFDGYFVMALSVQTDGFGLLAPVISNPF